MHSSICFEYNHCLVSQHGGLLTESLLNIGRSSNWDNIIHRQIQRITKTRRAEFSNSLDSPFRSIVRFPYNAYALCNRSYWNLDNDCEHKIYLCKIFRVLFATPWLIAPSPISRKVCRGLGNYHQPVVGQGLRDWVSATHCLAHAFEVLEKGLFVPCVITWRSSDQVTQ